MRRVKNSFIHQGVAAAALFMLSGMLLVSMLSGLALLLVLGLSVAQEAPADEVFIVDIKTERSVAYPDYIKVGSFELDKPQSELYSRGFAGEPYEVLSEVEYTGQDRDSDGRFADLSMPPPLEFRDWLQSAHTGGDSVALSGRSYGNESAGASLAGDYLAMNDITLDGRGQYFSTMRGGKADTLLDNIAVVCPVMADTYLAEDHIRMTATCDESDPFDQAMPVLTLNAPVGVAQLITISPYIGDYRYRLQPADGALKPLSTGDGNEVVLALYSQQPLAGKEYQLHLMPMNGLTETYAPPVNITIKTYVTAGQDRSSPPRFSEQPPRHPAQHSSNSTKIHKAGDVTPAPVAATAADQTAGVIFSTAALPQTGAAELQRHDAAAFLVTTVVLRLPAFSPATVLSAETAIAAPAKRAFDHEGAGDASADWHWLPALARPAAAVLMSPLS